MAYAPGGREATTIAVDVCAVVGCARRVYSGGHCSDHYEPPVVYTCDHFTGESIVCGCCERRVCFACYGHWKALACVQCREKAAS